MSRLCWRLGSAALLVALSLPAMAAGVGSPTIEHDYALVVATTPNPDYDSRKGIVMTAGLGSCFVGPLEVFDPTTGQILFSLKSEESIPANCVAEQPGVRELINSARQVIDTWKAR